MSTLVHIPLDNLNPVTALKTLLSPVCNTVLWSSLITKFHIEVAKGGRSKLNFACFPVHASSPTWISARHTCIIPHQHYMCHTNEVC
jgi:hypothetical protein